MAYLSDEDLRKRLEMLGEKVGPVTPTTRRTLEKRLDALLSQQNRTLNAFSSDDSDFEPLGTNRAPNKKKRHNHRPSTHSTFSPIGNRTPTQKEEVFKKPLSSATRHLSRSALGASPSTNSGGESRSSWHSRRSLGTPKERTSFDLELSDSDVDTEALVNPMRTLKLRNRNSNHVVRNSGDGYLKRSQRHFLSSSPNGDDYPQSAKNADQRNKDTKQPVSETSYRLTPLSERKYNKDCNANGYLISDSLNGMFASTSKTARTANYSVCVSWMLVFVAMAFFIFLGIFYMSAVQKTHFTASNAILESLKCIDDNNRQEICIPQKHFQPALLASHDLYDLLSRVAGDYECYPGKEKRSLTYSDTKLFVDEKLANYNVGTALSSKEVMNYAILLFVKIPEWGINVIASNGAALTHISEQSPVYASALESKHALKPFWCRVKHSIHWTVSRLLLVCFIFAAVCFVVLSVRYWKKRKDQEEKEFYELVERILDVLQNSDESSPCSSYANSALPSKAVAHLRDSIIPVKERRAKQHLWDKAVAFIEENESRVQVDFERIGGEEFKVWRWLPSPVSEIEEGKKGKVWQGQAFGSLSKGKNPVPHSPTPCLKIRNMFDSEVEYGDDWQICIQDAILEKCEGNNGIIHIAVDVTSKEGCVYMLCDSPESAGKAYNALHGWWFDGKLVTVKYLRLERYLQRFPDAEECDEPLKPSNNKRLSLSTPFFSSALERS